MTSNVRKEHGAVQCKVQSLSSFFSSPSPLLSNAFLVGFCGKQRSFTHLSPLLAPPPSSTLFSYPSLPPPSSVFLWLHLCHFLFFYSCFFSPFFLLILGCFSLQLTGYLSMTLEPSNYSENTCENILLIYSLSSCYFSLCNPVIKAVFPSVDVLQMTLGQSAMQKL